MTCKGAPAPAMTTRGKFSTGVGNGSVLKTVAFLLVAAIVLVDVIGVAECRYLEEDHQHQHQLQRSRRIADYDNEKGEYPADGPAAGEDAEDGEDNDSSENNSDVQVKPTIETTGLTIETIEGTTATLPCKAPLKSMNDIALMWINGTAATTIATEEYISTADPRVKVSMFNKDGFQEYNLVIEQLSKWDSGTYTCKFSLDPPAPEVKHTLRVIQPAKIVALKANGLSNFSNTGGQNKFKVKQGEPVILECEVDGNPTPVVQWTKKAKKDVSAGSTQSVINSKDVRIDSVAYRDAGYYECFLPNSHSTVSGPSATRMGLDLEVEYEPVVVVPRRVVNTGETYNAQMSCSVRANPKAMVTWQKEQTDANNSSSWLPVNIINGPQNRYSNVRLASTPAQNVSGNSSVVPTGPSYLLKVDKVQGPQDFGRYRCRAENALGVVTSEPIRLTGSPAQPLFTYVHFNTSGDYVKFPELGWSLDSWSPVVEYQMQWRRQQDSADSWTDVRPQPKVTESASNDAGDERKYTVRYTLGAEEPALGGQQPAGENAVVPPNLQYGTTYLARLRARNLHGWSEWSADAVFTGGYKEGQDANEIAQHGGHQDNDDKVLKGSVTGSATQLRSGGAITAAMVLAAALMATTAAASVH